jgi:hypothetical protein
MRSFQLIGATLGLALSVGCGAASADSSVSDHRVALEQADTRAGASAAALNLLARQALAQAKDSRAVEALRLAGAPGLQALLSEAEAAGRLDSTLDPLLDRVAGQRYARHARLYWYTDLDRARERARAERKPILSLRLLGDLRDDLSCANSRYFRVVLYPDPAIAALLRDSFVLHWSSERPAPKITVEYGDGRKLVRTITGNSAHYVLDAKGRVLDVLPGLIAPAAFAEELSEAIGFAIELRDVSDAEFARSMRARHGRAEMKLLNKWKSELEAQGVQLERGGVSALREQNLRFSVTVAAAQAAPPARVAARVAIGKGMVENRLLPEIVPFPTFTVNEIEKKSNGEVWQRVAKRHRFETQLSAASRALMRELAPRGFDSRGAPVPLDDAGFEKLIESFETSLALDTVQNGLDLRRRVHERLSSHPRDSFEELNRWLYASVFLTPRSDPWLGLTSDDAFTALPADGIVSAGSAQVPLL